MRTGTEADLVVHAERGEIVELFQDGMEFRQAALIAAQRGIDAQADAIEAEPGEERQALGVQRRGRQIDAADRGQCRQGESGIEPKHQFGYRFWRKLPRRIAAQPQTGHRQRIGQQRVDQFRLAAQEADIAVDGVHGTLNVESQLLAGQCAEALVPPAGNGLDIAVPGQHGGVESTGRGRNRARRRGRWAVLSGFAEHVRQCATVRSWMSRCHYGNVGSWPP